MQRLLSHLYKHCCICSFILGCWLRCSSLAPHNISEEINIGQTTNILRINWERIKMIAVEELLRVCRTVECGVHFSPSRGGLVSGGQICEKILQKEEIQPGMGSSINLNLQIRGACINCFIETN